MHRQIRKEPEGFSDRSKPCCLTQKWVPHFRESADRNPQMEAYLLSADNCGPTYVGDGSPESVPFLRKPIKKCIAETRSETFPRGYEPPEGSAVLTVSDKKVTLKPEPTQFGSLPSEPNAAECCDKARSLDAVRLRFDKLKGNVIADASTPTPTCRPELLQYPCRGIIKPPPIDPMDFTSKQGNKCGLKNQPCKANLFTEGAEDQASLLEQRIKEQKQLNGWESIQKDRTCDYYRLDEKLPVRFNNPIWFRGYGCERPAHPFYLTTTSDYGRFGPNPHTMPNRYYPMDAKFTAHLGPTGMYRNRTLNTSNEKTIV